MGRTWPGRPLNGFLARAALGLAIAASPCLVVAGAEPGFGLGLDRVVPSAAPVWHDSGRTGGRIGTGEIPLPDPTADVRAHEGPPSLPARLRDDLGALATAPLRWEGRDWRRFGLGIAVVGAVALLDDEADRLVDRSRSRSMVRAAEALRPLGHTGSFVLIGGAWLAGRGLDRPELSAVAEDALEASILAAGLITPALKVITGRARPRDGHDADGLGGSGGSFPSGEATQAFAIASVVAAHSDRTWVRATAWGLASLVGLSRMELDAHWASDVVAGALVGAAVGRWVVRRNRPELGEGPRVELAPTVERDRVGVALAVRF